MLKSVSKDWTTKHETEIAMPIEQESPLDTIEWE